MSNRSALRVAMIALAVAGMAACAKKPAPQTPMNPSGPSGPTQPGIAPAPSTPVQPGNMGPAAGSVQDFVINAGDRVYFDFDSYSVRSDAEPILNAQANWLNRYRGVSVRIEGNADERGTREYNFALGGRRANAIRDYLVARGVASGRIETISYGKERPVDGGSNEEAWARNRNGHTAIVGGAAPR